MKPLSSDVDYLWGADRYQLAGVCFTFSVSLELQQDVSIWHL